MCYDNYNLPLNKNDLSPYENARMFLACSRWLPGRFTFIVIIHTEDFFQKKKKKILESKVEPLGKRGGEEQLTELHLQ